MAVNKIIIESNPFEKRVMYFWRGADGAFKKITAEDDSKLSSGDYTNTAFRNKAYEIVETIQKEFHTSDELEIGFIGTEEDYGVLCSTVEEDFKDAHIKCTKENKSYKDAKNAMPEIKEIFAELQDIFDNKQFEVDKIKEPIKKYNDTIKPEITLCVIGLYSAGKSTFINSLIGTEILPTADVPTTAKNYKIFNRDIYEIYLEIEDGNACNIHFEGRDISISDSNHNKVLEAIIEDIRKNVDITHDEKHHMREFLELLNCSQEIETETSVVVSLPFENTGLPFDEYEFVIYDTPGPNSEKNRDHFEKLMKALGDQTNALPIVITRADNTDARDNKLIRNSISNAGENLDIANTLTVINQADKQGETSLEKIKNAISNYEVIDLKSANVLVMSSLWGCACKKNNPKEESEWLDRDLYSKFKYESAEKMEEIDYSTYNKINKNQEENKRGLYQNSGLKAVEDEIADYAEHLALYNKCNQASLYLKKAIDESRERTKAIKQSIEEKKSRVENRLSKKEKELSDRLIGYVNITEGDCCDKFEEKMSSIIEDFKAKNKMRDGNQNDIKSLKGVLQKYEKEHIAGKDNKDKINEMETQVQWGMYTLMEGLNKLIDKKNQEYWENVTKNLKNKCMNIVSEDNALAEAQKKELQETIKHVKKPDSNVSIGLREKGIIKPRKFLWKELESEKINLKECAKAMVEEFNKAVGNKTGKFLQENRDEFKKFAEKMKNEIIAKLADFNVEVKRYSDDIKKLSDELDEKRKLEDKLNEKKEEIKKLLGEQEGA